MDLFLQIALPENVPYREETGGLLYIANALRPDVSHTVNILSLHQLKPTQSYSR